MRRSNALRHAAAGPLPAWWSRVGLAGFLFFLVKGLLWLSAPALYALMR